MWGWPFFFGYALQTLGLGSISSSQSAFITAMYVPIVPFLQWFFLRKPPHLMVWLGVLFAFSGLVLLTGPQAIAHMHLQFGEVVTLVSAVAIAMEVVLISRFASPAINSFRVAIVQLLVAGLLAFAAMPIMHEHVPALTWWWVLPGLGLGAMSAVIQLVMNWAQKTVSPTRATLIYAGEPVWAGLVGRLAGICCQPERWRVARWLFWACWPARCGCRAGRGGAGRGVPCKVAPVILPERVIQAAG